MEFQELDLYDLQVNPFTMIQKDWMLITAGTKDGFNTMTASWGNVGIMWNKTIATVFIRPQRYTKTFVDTNERLTLSVLGEQYRSALKLCGTKSGRDCDKVKEAGLTPYFLEGTTAFAEAELIFVCKKLYTDSIRPAGFFDAALDEANYPNKDYHQFYMVEIEKVLIKK